MADRDNKDTNSRDDKVFKQWAEGYAEQYGKSLLQEQQMLDQQGINYATPRADARLQSLTNTSTKQQTNERKKRRRMPYFAAAAALVLVFVGVSATVLQLNSQIFDVSAPTQSDQAADSSLDAADKIQSLDFALPTQFSVAEVEWDNGETIYHLDNSQYDDAILTIKEADGSKVWMADMDKIYIDETPVPAKLRDEYKLVTFESRGSLYTISCRDDIETLATLYRSVTEQDRKNV